MAEVGGGGGYGEDGEDDGEEANDGEDDAGGPGARAAAGEGTPPRTHFSRPGMGHQSPVMKGLILP